MALMLQLDGDGPLHRQLYVALRRAVLDGRLPPGSRVPSSRELSVEVGVSRNTALQAVEQLVAEGYAAARRGAGTFVSESFAPPERQGGAGGAAANAAGGEIALSSFGRAIGPELRSAGRRWGLPRSPVLRFDFRYGEPPYAELPLDAWARLLGRRARRLSARRLGYQPPGGAPELREALTAYLGRARGVRCDPEQVIVTQGSQQAIDLCIRLLVDPGDPVVLEEPHYTGLAFCVAAARARPVYVPVDGEGLCTDALRGVAAARLACVTPSHQFPTGAVLSGPRRAALLEWAEQRRAAVLEDDYDGEFRYEGRPLSSLQSLDRGGRVVYVGTASKALFPALRIGWAVVPPALVDAFRDAKAIADTGTATVEQLAFADFIHQGHLERHVRRARRRHAARRAALLAAVDRHLGDRATVVGTGAGVHVMLRIEDLPHRDVPALRAACRARGVGVYPTAPYYARAPVCAELLLGYAALDEASIEGGIRGLAEALDQLA